MGTKNIKFWGVAILWLKYGGGYGICLLMPKSINIYARFFWAVRVNSF